MDMGTRPYAPAREEGQAVSGEDNEAVVRLWFEA
jgi:hypothetical protein